MTQPNLGNLLAQHIADEKAQTRSAQERAAGHVSEQARRDYEEVAAFFDKARERFTADIVAGVPSKKLGIQVGSSGGYGIAGADDHAHIYRLIAGYNYANDIPTSLVGNGSYSALWVEFTGWAAEQGLRAFWQYAHDGGGMCSWWMLRIEPAASQQRVIPRSESPTQRRQRVLSDTLEAYLDACTALQAMRDHPRAQAHLVKFGATLSEAKALFAEMSAVRR